MSLFDGNFTKEDEDFYEARSVEDEIQSLRQQLAVKDLEVMQLRETLEKVLDNTYALSPKADFIIEALSTTFTPDHLMAWLGEPEIWLTQKEYETLKRAQKTERETTPLYAPKLDMKG
jgi:hypothetical protein